MNVPIADIRTAIKANADSLTAAAAKLMEAYEILEGQETPPHDAASNGATKPLAKVVEAKKTLSRADPFYNVLKAHGSSMERKAILEAAQKKGSKITKLDTASVYMSDDSRFCKAGRGQWGLSEWDKST